MVNSDPICRGASIHRRSGPRVAEVGKKFAFNSHGNQTSCLVGQRQFERLIHLETRWSTGFSRFCISNAAKAAKAWTPAQSGAVQLVRTVFSKR
jgi:hypothetical protein